jgi:hypothetical protein
MFYIGFITATRVDERGVPYAEGDLSADAYRDGFLSDLRLWSKREYEAQWKQGVARLLTGAQSSALVTSLPPADDEDGLRLIPLWRDGGIVYVGGSRVLKDARPEPFDVASIYERVGELPAMTDERVAKTYGRVPLGQLATFSMDE